MIHGRYLLVAAIFAVAVIVSAASSFAFVALTRSPGQGKVPVGGPFTLVDDAGTPVTESALKGKPSVIYFGYTFCPDVCPTTLFDLSRWIQKLGPDADKLNYVFVTVDPQRDTSKVMHDYVSSFDKHIRGFTGTPEQIAKIAHEYPVHYKRVQSDNSGYVMDHSTPIYLMGTRGTFVGAIAYQEDDASAIAKLRKLLAMTADS
jgi:protein SCO1/2